QLEFRLIKAPKPPEGGCFELKGAILPAGLSLWAVLEQFSFTEGESMIIRNEQHEKVGTLSFEELMSVFYQYKKQQAHE
ncbi:MAG: hypothetical protein ACREGF_05520, partial [Candidatus Saccharimonadales bacterium]